MLLYAGRDDPQHAVRQRRLELHMTLFVGTVIDALVHAFNAELSPGYS